MAKSVVEEFEIDGVAVRLTKVDPVTAKERIRYVAELDGVTRGYMILKSGVSRDWQAWSVRGEPKHFNDFNPKAYNGTQEEKRRKLAREMITWMKDGKALLSPEELAAEAAAESARRQKENEDYASRRAAQIQNSADTILGIKALRERLGTELSNHEAHLIEEALKLMFSGAPGGTRDLVDKAEEEARNARPSPAPNLK